MKSNPCLNQFHLFDWQVSIQHIACRYLDRCSELGIPGVDMRTCGHADNDVLALGQARAARPAPQLRVGSAPVLGGGVSVVIGARAIRATLSLRPSMPKMRFMVWVVPSLRSCSMSCMVL